jgi:VWFA-related protein
MSHLLRGRSGVSPPALKLIASCATLALLALTLTAQTLSPEEVRVSSHPYEPPSETLRTESRLVQVEVVVRDSSGHAVADLTKDDFALFDSGQLRNVSDFLVEKSSVASPPAVTNSPAPRAVSGKPNATIQALGPSRSIALLFDDINTPSGDLIRAKIAARRFISEATRSGDRIGVFTTSQGQVLPFTTDASAVLSSMTTVQSHPRISPAGLSACPRITPYEAYLIVNNDPATTSAKLIEACNCSGEHGLIPCPADITVTPLSIQELPPELSRLLSEVVEQARSTWNEMRFVTETTPDAVHGAISQLAKAAGTRILLFASSGFLSGDLGPEEQELINEALRANVAIDSLDSKGLYAEQPGGPQGEPSHTPSGPDLIILSDMKSFGDQIESEDYAMADFAEGTGGLLFRNSNDLDYGFRELGLAPAYAYLLGFSPDEDGKYHKIKVKLKNANHDFVQARPGYFAPMKETTKAKEAKEASQPTPKDGIDAEVNGTDERSDFPLNVSAKTAADSKGNQELTVQTHVDIAKLPFETEKDRHDEKLTFVVALFDAQGKFIVGKEADMEFAFKQDSFDRFSRSGITGEMSLEAPAGSYRLRVVLEEGVKGEMSATNQNIQIP